MTDVENLSRTGTRAVKRGGPGLTGNRNARSADLQIFRRFLATVRDDVEAHLRAFCQAGGTGPFHRRDMDKHVLAAAVRLNETKTLRRVEPLHRPSRHFSSPFE